MTSTNPGASTPLAPGARRPPRRPHRYTADRDAPGACLVCRLIKANAIHNEQAIAAAEAEAHQAQAEERRRLGERED